MAQHSNYPSERNHGAALSPATFAVVDADMQRREDEYQRYLDLFNTPEYQAKLAGRLCKKGGAR